MHKLLTGRRDGFARLRSAGGLSGYPSRAESEHDLVENPHASTALSYADGLARAFALRGRSDRAFSTVATCAEQDYFLSVGKRSFFGTESMMVTDVNARQVCGQYMVWQS